MQSFQTCLRSPLLLAFTDYSAINCKMNLSLQNKTMLDASVWDEFDMECVDRDWLCVCKTDIRRNLVHITDTLDGWNSRMKAKVAIVRFKNGDVRQSFNKALQLIGGIDDINDERKQTVIKVGVFNVEAGNHSSVDVVDAITKGFDRSRRILIVESDNYQGTGTQRLQIWKDLANSRISLFDLSKDPETVPVKLAGFDMNLSHVLCKPNVIVDTHILRTANVGSILKNLFGCVPERKRVKFHKREILDPMLADTFEAMGGIDLSVLDGTYVWSSYGDSPIPANIIIVGRDAVAVEAVGGVLCGLEPEQMPVIQEFVRRGLGEGRIDRIEILGEPFDEIKNELTSALKAAKKSRGKGPKTWSGKASRALRAMIKDGFFSQPGNRSLENIVRELSERGIDTKDKKEKIVGLLARRVKKGLLKKIESPNGEILWKD